jgi:carbon storage regulator
VKSVIGTWQSNQQIDAGSDTTAQEGLNQVLRKGIIMLVLSRKKNESIVINNDITIVVVEIRGDKVRLGVEAPKEVHVHRREVYEAIKSRQNEAADAEASPEPAAEAS